MFRQRICVINLQPPVILDTKIYAVPSKNNGIPDLPLAEQKGSESGLTPHEEEILKKCEGIVERGWDAFVEVGMAIAQINEGRLYRVRFKTFEAYCRVNLPYTLRHANRLVAAAQVVTELGPTGPILPKNEKQVRHLIGLPKKQFKRLG